MDETERRWRKQQVEAAMRAMRGLASDCHRQSTVFSRLAKFVGNRSRILTLLAASVAAAAGATALPAVASRVVVGVIAICSAVLGSISATFATDLSKSDQYWARAGALEELGWDISKWLDVDSLEPRRRIEAPEVLVDFRSRRSEVEQGLPLRRTPYLPSSGWSRSEDFSWVLPDAPSEKTGG